MKTMSCPSYQLILQLVNLTMLFMVATKLEQICHKVIVVQLEGYIALKIPSINHAYLISGRSKQFV